MSSHPSVIQLVTEVLDSGRSPDEVCAEWPDQLDEVRRRVARCRQLESRLDFIFPSSEDGLNGEETHFAAKLPLIPLYEVQAIIGHGGMGVVYRAQHLKLKRLVALKMIRSGAYASPAELSRFFLEAEAIAELHHANIVQIYDLGEFDGRPYFTMEFLEGGSLAQKLAGAPIPPAAAAQHLASLASATQIAHKAGIVHRDLKPANLLLGSGGELKISDFGLARRMAVEDGLTFGGARIGTPSYMAPEQAAGRTGTVGPSADIYSLGAILYEMLTGRPPFRGASAAETERQVINDDPAPPSRLNTAVPHDLETICLKCLRKEPGQRYATCADLAADTNRYLRGEPIHARPVGAIERSIKWTRRRPALAVSLAAGLVLILGAAGGALWFLSARSARGRAVNADLKLVDDLERQGRWDAARTALLRASIELGSHGPAELHRQLDQDNRDLDLVARLDAIKLNHMDVAGDRYRFKGGESYKSAFNDAGLQMFGSDESSVAAKIRNSAIRLALKAAIDDWIVSNFDAQQRQWLLEIALATDENPTEWQRMARDPKISIEKPELTRLLAVAPIAKEPVSMLAELGRQLTDLKGDAVPFLIKVQQQYPGDFWANLALGYAEMNAGNIEETIRFFQAAVVIRPDAAIAENNLSWALAAADHSEEAVVHGRNAVRLDPSNAACHFNLAAALTKTGQNQEALQQFQVAAKLAPSNPMTHLRLGQWLELLGRQREALDEYNWSLRLDPTEVIDSYKSRPAMMGTDLLEEHWAEWKKSIDAAPPDFQAWNGYLELSLYLGHEDEYRSQRSRLLAQSGKAPDAYAAERMGRACLLLPASDEETQKAVALVDQAVNADRSTVAVGSIPYFQVAKALAYFRQGQLDSAADILHNTPAYVLKPMPRLMLAMIQQQQGNTEEARRTLEESLKLFDWSTEHAVDADAWMFHVIRRQAEEMINPATQPSGGL